MTNIEIILLSVQITVSVLLIIMTLFQKDGEDSLSGIGGGSGGMSVMSQKTGNALVTRITMILVAIFLINSLAFGVMTSRTHDKSSKSELEHFIQKQTENKKPELPQ